jgi:hypothetical protein
LDGRSVKQMELDMDRIWLQASMMTVKNLPVPLLSTNLVQGIFLLCRPGPRFCAYREAHINFADESACLTAENLRNEIVTIHRSSQMVSKMPSSLHVDTFRNCFVKKHRYNNPSCTYSTPDNNFHWMASAILLPFLH